MCISSMTVFGSPEAGHLTWSLTRIMWITKTPSVASKTTRALPLRPFFSIAPVAAMMSSVP